MHMVKNVSIILGLVIIGCLAIGTYVFFFDKQVDNAYAATLYVESGDVYTKEMGSEAYVLVTGEVAIETGTFIKTGDGYAYVLLPDTSLVSVESNSEMQMNFSPTKTSVTQLFGNTYHRVRTLTQGDSYEVFTPTTVASVRGTVFGVSYATSTKVTKVAVTESMVAVKENNSRSTSTEESVVTEGKVVIVEAETASSTPKRKIVAIDQDVEVKKWIETTRALDVIFENKKQNKEVREDAVKRVVEVTQEEQRTEKETRPNTKPEREVIIKRAAQKLEKEMREDVKKEELREETKETPTQPLPTQPKPTTETKPTTSTTEAPVRIIVDPVVTIEMMNDTPRVIDFSQEMLPRADELYLNEFYALFEKHLYLGATDTACTNIRGLTGDQVGDKIATFAKMRGYVLPNMTGVRGYIDELVSYCKAPNDADRARLNTRFDVVYPYSG